MKDKQEQIEEMVGILVASNNPFVDVPIEIMPNVAEALYNAGYRKVFSNKDNFTDLLNEEIKELFLINRTRKEIAKEILQDLLNYCALYGCVTNSYILEQTEKYGVEVEE